ncbi:hypothetical protein SAZ11_26935 [Streptomyces sp. FXJ1.4098]|nr:hypothetical protein [Streptomyces sp. FXJ1.4098]
MAFMVVLIVVAFAVAALAALGTARTRRARAWGTSAYGGRSHGSWWAGSDGFGGHSHGDTGTQRRTSPLVRWRRVVVWGRLVLRRRRRWWLRRGQLTHGGSASPSAPCARRAKARRAHGC